MTSDASTHPPDLTDCPECMGIGWIDAKNCSSCKGSGKIIVHSHAHGHGTTNHDHPHAHAAPHHPDDQLPHTHAHD